MQNVFPILVHGDDADVHRRRSYCAVTIGSPLLAGQSSWDCKFLSYIIDTSRAVTETYDTLDSWMVYGLCELQEGRFLMWMCMTTRSIEVTRVLSVGSIGVSW